jgi:hypothetical protein
VNFHAVPNSVTVHSIAATSASDEAAGLRIRTLA